MSPYMLEAAVQPDNPPIYDLYATVNHSGISYGGHYSATVKPPTAMETGAKGSHFEQTSKVSFRGEWGLGHSHLNLCCPH